MNSIFDTLLLIVPSAAALGLLVTLIHALRRGLLLEQELEYARTQAEATKQQLIQDRLKQVETLRDSKRDVEYATEQLVAKEREAKQLRAQVHALSAENEALRAQLRREQSQLRRDPATRHPDNLPMEAADLSRSDTWSRSTKHAETKDEETDSEV